MKALKHIREWTDPLEGVSLLTSRPVEEVLLLDTFPAELHTHRMNLGNFYHYLILEFMQTLGTRTNSTIERAYPGQREGDIVADLKTPGDQRGIRLYGSVKKNRQTVGGQDFGDAGGRLEAFAIGDQARNRPYLCAYIAVNPIPGKRTYEDSRFIAGNRGGQRHSQNGEIWGPEFIFPYVCGHSPAQIYEMARPIVEEQFPYYTVDSHGQARGTLKEFKLRLT